MLACCADQPVGPGVPTELRIVNRGEAVPGISNRESLFPGMSSAILEKGDLEVPGKVRQSTVIPFDAELKGSIGEGPNHSNYSDRSSVRIHQ